MIEYKTWVGKWPHVILLPSEKAFELLYYETGFEQLHPLPEIIDWMQKRSYNYLDDWRVVKVGDKDQTFAIEWAICFKDKQSCELFVLKWL